MTDDAPRPGRAAEIEPFWLAFQRECGVEVEGFSAAALGHTARLADERADGVEEHHEQEHAEVVEEKLKELKHDR